MIYPWTRTKLTRQTLHAYKALKHERRDSERVVRKHEVQCTDGRPTTCRAEYRRGAARGAD